MASTGPFPVTVHSYASPTDHACAYEMGLTSAPNALVFIGGLGDGPHTVPYPRAIAKGLGKHTELGYSVFEFRMTSSFQGFGFSNLANDVADISALVEYLRSIGRKKIVLMGHSTGCQDCMEYTSPVYKDNAPVDGFILQGPVSDRDAIGMEMDQGLLDSSLKTAKAIIDGGRSHYRMPTPSLPASFHKTPICAARWYALGAVDGEDNYFSHDLPHDVISKYWQRFEKSLLILHSEKDEFVPASIDKEALVQSWKTLCRPGIASDLSGTIPGANHRVEEPEAEEWLTRKVIKFLESIK